MVENFDQKEADLARSIESHVAETQRAQDEIKQLKKDVMKHRKRGKDLANELGRLQGETRSASRLWVRVCMKLGWCARRFARA